MILQEKRARILFWAPCAAFTTRFPRPGGSRESSDMPFNPGRSTFAETKKPLLAGAVPAIYNLQSDIIAQHPQIYPKLPNTRATHFRAFPKAPNTRATDFRVFRKVPNTRATSFPVFRKGPNTAATRFPVFRNGKSTSATTFPETFSHRPSSLKALVLGKSLKTKNLSVSGKVRFTGYDS